MSQKSEWRGASMREQVQINDNPRILDQQVENLSRHQQQSQDRVFHDNAHDQLLNEGRQDIGDDSDSEQEQYERHRLISSGFHGSQLGWAKSLPAELARFNFNRNKHRASWRSNPRAVLIIVLTIGACGLILVLRSYFDEADFHLNLDNQLVAHLDEAHRKQLEQDQQTRWLVSTPKCHIPLLDPWDKSIKEYVSRESPMNCTAILNNVIAGRGYASVPRNWTSLRANSMSFVKSNKLFFTEQAIEWGALAGEQKPGQCCFKRLTRAIADDDHLEHGPCEPIFDQGLSVDSSVIEVICAAWNYTNVHSFVVHNQAEEEALARVGRQKLSPDNDFYSILMVGVDTISRLNGLRQLSNTLQTLKTLYGALEFVGYNKVGENTFPNLIPLLTGLTPEQLTQIQCWEAQNYTLDESSDDYLDNCKFLWSYYQQIGYLTYLAEDWPAASTFNYLKPGFKYEPTAFYGRPFTLAREHLVYPTWKAPGCASCQLDRPLVEVDIENLRAFIENNTNKLPYLAIQWFNCPQHDDLNGASKVDHVFERFFRELAPQLESDRTFVMFFSDHGYRWNDFVSTRVGHYESSLPLLMIAPPKAFIDRHPKLYERMKSHQNSLLTPFDLFKTLIDLRDLSSVGRLGTREKREQRYQMELLGQKPREGITILPESSPATTTTAFPNKIDVTDANTRVKQLEPIDGTRFKQNFTILSLFDQHTTEQLNRGCIDAGIPDSYCVCHQFQPVASDNLDVLGAAYYLVYVHLEALLAGHLDKCHYLHLERIHQAEMFNLTTNSRTRDKTRRRRELTGSDKRKILNQKTSSRPTIKHLHGENDDQNRHNYLSELEYSIMFSTKPGGGLFKEVVRYYGTNMTNCKLEVMKTQNVIVDRWATNADKHESVLTMNDVCDFSVHSASLSRFNLYGDQSKCVKSNSELKKLCYCRDLDG